MEISKYQKFHLIELIDTYTPHYSNFILGDSNIKFHPSFKNNYLIYIFGTKETILSIGLMIFENMKTIKNFSGRIEDMFKDILFEYAKKGDVGKFIDILFDLHFGDFGKAQIVRDQKHPKETIIAGVKQLRVVEDRLPDGGSIITISDPKDQPQTVSSIIRAVTRS